MRNTKQKELILNIIRNSYDHLKAEEIYAIAQKTIPDISLGTVYRNLNTLLFEHKISKIKMPDGDHFDNINRKHHHFICTQCQKIIDIEQMITLPFPIGDFEIKDYDIYFKGTCQECLNKENQ